MDRPCGRAFLVWMRSWQGAEIQRIARAPSPVARWDPENYRSAKYGESGICLVLRF